MNYWVLKGRPAENDWDQMLRQGEEQNWHTRKPPSSWQRSDRLFCWESSPNLRIIGLAELINPSVELDSSGETLFRVKYRSSALESRPTITELRKMPIISEASFLKSGPATTVQSLSTTQAEALIRLVYSRNPEIEVVWDDVDLNAFGAIVPDLELRTVGLEGKKRLVSHFVRERDQQLVETKKRVTLKAFGRLSCEICAFDFEVVYGLRGRDFC